MIEILLSLEFWEAITPALMIFVIPVCSVLYVNWLVDYVAKKRGWTEGPWD